MARIDLTTTVAAPVERVFDLARSVDCHVETMAGHDEAAVDGVTAGLLERGDEVTWRARHFGVPVRMRVAVTELDRPTHFRDEQVAGPFAHLVHDHRFEAAEEGTRKHDAFRSPLAARAARPPGRRRRAGAVPATAARGPQPAARGRRLGRGVGALPRRPAGGVAGAR